MKPQAPLVAWVSLDEDDNEPALFWTYALTALDAVQPGLCTQLLTYLQTQQAPKPPLRNVLQALINSLASRSEQFLLVLDDYHVITQPEVHHSLTYLVEHLSPQLHIILATRADPPCRFLCCEHAGRCWKCEPTSCVAQIRRSWPSSKR